MSAPSPRKTSAAAPAAPSLRFTSLERAYTKSLERAFPSSATHFQMALNADASIAAPTPLQAASAKELLSMIISDTVAAHSQDQSNPLAAVAGKSAVRRLAELYMAMSVQLRRACRDEFLVIAKESPITAQLALLDRLLEEQPALNESDASASRVPVPVLPQSMIEEQIIQTKKQYLGVLNAAIAQAATERQSTQAELLKARQDAVAAESFLSTLLSHDRQMNVTQPTVAAAPAHKPRGRQPKDKEPVPAGVQAPSLPALPAGMVPIPGAATVPVVTVNDSEEDREVEDTIMRVMQAASPTSSSPPAYTPTASGVSRVVPGSVSVNTPKSNVGSFAFGSAAKPVATPTADVTSIFLRDDMDETEGDSRRHSIQSTRPAVSPSYHEAMRQAAVAVVEPVSIAPHPLTQEDDESMLQATPSLLDPSF